jgi:hypothetical protein
MVRLGGGIRPDGELDELGFEAGLLLGILRGPEPAAGFAQGLLERPVERFVAQNIKAS